MLELLTVGCGKNCNTTYHSASVLQILEYEFLILSTNPEPTICWRVVALTTTILVGEEAGHSQMRTLLIKGFVRSLKSLAAIEGNT